VYGFVRPATGQTSWLLLPTVNTHAMNLALAACARDMRAGSDKHILLVVDNAGWHGSKTLVVPEGIELVYLPPATPELQPAKHLWPLLREAVANQTFATLDPLQETLVERCLQLAAQADTVQRTTNFHWLPIT
jgi:transposase